jgi:radical SAM superfamily enzyme
MLILPLLSFYLFQIGELVRTSYLTKIYQQEIQKLSAENVVLQDKMVELLSLENVEEKIKVLNFVKNEEVKYIPISSEYLVRETR